MTGGEWTLGTPLLESVADAYRAAARAVELLRVLDRVHDQGERDRALAGVRHEVRTVRDVLRWVGVDDAPAPPAETSPLVQAGLFGEPCL